MSEQLADFKSFQNEAIAIEFAEVLNTAGVYCKISKTPRFLDTQNWGGSSTPDYLIRLLPEDFTKANKLLEQHFDASVNEIDKDYYLFSFSKDELLDILYKPDEWGPFDIQLAKKLLLDKGIKITEEDLEKLKRERKSVLEKPEAASAFLYIISWFFLLISILYLIRKGFRQEDFIVLLFPISSFLIGRHFFRDKKIMPDGEAVFNYHEKDRKAGKVIMQVALIVAFLCVTKFILSGFIFSEE